LAQQQQVGANTRQEQQAGEEDEQAIKVKPSNQEAYLLIKQAITCKVRLHLLQGDGKSMIYFPKAVGFHPS
jgi:hypothetical protein